MVSSVRGRILHHLILVFIAVTSEPSKPRKRRKSVKIEFEEHHIGSQLVAMSDAADAATEVGAIATKKVRKKKEAIVYNPGRPRFHHAKERHRSSLGNFLAEDLQASFMRKVL